MKLKASGGTYFGQPIIIVCDCRCEKAWGISNRPQLQLSDDENDSAYLADGELGEAPTHPGTWEGGEVKPLTPEGPHNKWCARECERSVMIDPGEIFELPDFSQRYYNYAPHTRTIVNEA